MPNCNFYRISLKNKVYSKLFHRTVSDSESVESLNKNGIFLNGTVNVESNISEMVLDDTEIPDAQILDTFDDSEIPDKEVIHLTKEKLLSFPKSRIKSIVKLNDKIWLNFNENSKIANAKYLRRKIVTLCSWASMGFVVPFKQ